MTADNTDSDSRDNIALRQALVDKLKGGESPTITMPRVEAAFRAVPRHLFVPGAPLERVYSDDAVITKRQDGVPVSSSSQPAIMAIMLEQLDLQPGHTVLEIGAGTGYNAALLAHIVGDKGQVVTMDIDRDLVDAARAHLSAAGYDGVEAACGDGALGYPKAAPYDRIILTVGAWDILPAWRKQLKPGGRLLLPLSIKGGIQKSIAFEEIDGHLESASVKGCGFMYLRGEFAHERWTPIGPEPVLVIAVHDAVEFDAETVYRLLTGSYVDEPTGVEIATSELEGTGLWVTLHESGTCTVMAEGEAAESGIVPGIPMTYSPGGTAYCGVRGVLSTAGLCLMTRLPGLPTQDAKPEPDETTEMYVRTYGRDPDLSRRLIESIRAWDRQGRTGTLAPEIRAYPVEADYASEKDEIVVSKRWTKLVVTLEPANTDG